MQPSQSMIWDGQGPVMIGRYDPINGRPDTGYLVDLYRIGCGTSSLTTSLSVERASIKESCSGQRLTLKNYITGKTLEVGLNMVQFSGRTLAGAFFGETSTAQASTNKTQSVELMNIYVANVPYSVKDQDLRELFEPFGEVTSAKIIMDKATNRSRGGLSGFAVSSGTLT